MIFTFNYELNKIYLLPINIFIKFKKYRRYRLQVKLLQLTGINELTLKYRIKNFMRY